MANSSGVLVLVGGAAALAFLMMSGKKSSSAAASPAAPYLPLSNDPRPVYAPLPSFDARPLTVGERIAQAAGGASAANQQTVGERIAQAANAAGAANRPAPKAVGTVESDYTRSVASYSDRWNAYRAAGGTLGYGEWAAAGEPLAGYEEFERLKASGLFDQQKHPSTYGLPPPPPFPAAPIPIPPSSFSGSISV